MHGNARDGTERYEDAIFEATGGRTQTVLMID